MADDLPISDYPLFAAAVGKATLRWADIEGQWHGIFMVLVAIAQGGTAKIDLVNSLYYSHRNATNQRSMTVAFAKALLGPDNAAAKLLGQLNERTGKLAKKRNAIQHTTFILRGPSRENSVLVASTLAPVKINGNVLKYVQDLDPQIDQLAIDLVHWHRDLPSRLPTPLPGRPPQPSPQNQT